MERSRGGVCVCGVGVEWSGGVVGEEEEDPKEASEQTERIFGH